LGRRSYSPRGFGVQNCCRQAQGYGYKTSSNGTPCNTAIAIFLAKNWLGMTDRRETVVNMVQHAGPGQIVVNEETKKKMVEISQFIRREALLEQQRQDELGNLPNGS